MKFAYFDYSNSLTPRGEYKGGHRALIKLIILAYVVWLIGLTVVTVLDMSVRIRGDIFAGFSVLIAALIIAEVFYFLRPKYVFRTLVMLSFLWIIPTTFYQELLIVLFPHSVSTK